MLIFKTHYIDNEFINLYFYTMSNTYSDNLLKLIKTLTKAEKRSFRLYATRNFVDGETLKFLTLFDFMEKSTKYSDNLALQRITSIQKVQLSNIKAHLYKQLLTSLRLQHVSKRADSEIREMYDHAQILYQKGFYLQALKMLDKAKNSARKIHSDMLLLSIVQFEKIIESQYITRSISSRADELTNESTELEARIRGSVLFSNISLQLYSLYLKVGLVRDEKDFIFVKEFFYSRLPSSIPKNLSVEERLHLYTAYVRYNHIIQDFVMSYKYAKAWVNLFLEHPALISQDNEMYIKGVHNLLLALFNLRSYDRFVNELNNFKQEGLPPSASENVFLLYKQYVYTNQINQCYLDGNFESGLKLVPEIELFIEASNDKLDTHRIMVFYYKIACLYFGIGNSKRCIFYLNKIFQMKDHSIREDIQGFSRILNLIAHFELGNADLVEYQLKSVYRYLSKLGDLQGVQREIMMFIRKLPQYQSQNELKRAFRQLHAKLVKLSQSRYEKRPFMYLDIISWLESKLENKSVQAVIQSKFLSEMKTGKKHYFPKL